MTKKLEERIMKLRNLAERGVEGEQKTAQEKLDKLLKENGIMSIDELDEELNKEYKYNYEGRCEFALLRQCVYKVLGSGSETKMQFKDNKLVVLCNKYQSIEIELEYSFYKEILRKEMDIFTDAFIQAQKIFPVDVPKGNYEDSENDKKMSRYANSIERRIRLKALGME